MQVAVSYTHLGVLPGVLDTVQINAPGTYQVTLSTTAAVQSVQMLSTGASLLDTGTLDLAGALSLGAGLFTLASGGEIVGGTLSTSGGSFDWAGGTLSGATYLGTLDLTGTGESLTIANGLSVTGAGGIGTINAAGGATALDFIGTQTLNNALVDMGNTAGGATALNLSLIHI